MRKVSVDKIFVTVCVCACLYIGAAAEMFNSGTMRVLYVRICDTNGNFSVCRFAFM